MIDKQLFKFYISYRLNGEVCLEWVEGINLRHAREKIQFQYPEATDLMDWTNETKEELEHYIQKIKNKQVNKSTNTNIR